MSHRAKPAPVRAPAAERILGVGMRESSSLKECERAPEGAWAKQPSDCEGRRPGGIGLGGIGGKNVAAGRRADRMRVAAKPLR